jgi:hypothetical protein
MSIARFKNVEELLGFAREFFDNRLETFQKDIAIRAARRLYGSK